MQIICGNPVRKKINRSEIIPLGCTMLNDVDKGFSLYGNQISSNMANFFLNTEDWLHISCKLPLLLTKIISKAKQNSDILQMSQAKRITGLGLGKF